MAKITRTLDEAKVDIKEDKQISAEMADAICAALNVDPRAIYEENKESVDMKWLRDQIQDKRIEALEAEVKALKSR